MSDSLEVLNSLLNSRTPESEAAIISLSRYIASNSLSITSFEMYAKILHRNIPEAADILFAKREPFSFFSVLPVNRNLISFALSTLSEYKYPELYNPIIEACFGICMQCYQNATDGLNIYRISVTEIYHISKYLMKKDDKIESYILDLLESFSDLQQVADVSQISRKILNHSLDHSKSLSQIIPSVILSA